MKIQYGSVFGNYRWSAEAEVGDELVSALVPLGALQIAQRSPSSKAEKAMAGYEKRPKGFNRAKEIPFTPKGAAILASSLRKMLVEIGRDEKDEPIHVELEADVSVEEYTGAGAADSVYKAEREVYDRHEKADDMEAFAEKIGFDGETAREAVEGSEEKEAPKAFLIAIRNYVKEQLKSL